MRSMTKSIYLAMLVMLVFSAVSCSRAEEKVIDEQTPPTSQQPQSEQIGFYVADEQDVAERSAAVVPIYNVIKVNAGKSPAATDFTWEENGKTKSFKDITKNKVVFLNFWGTWCPPCRKEIPDIISIHKELNPKDFIVVGIALGRGRMAELNDVGTFMQSQKIPYINFIGPNELVNAFGGVEFVPTTLIIDKKGNIVEKIVGGKSKEGFMQSIRKYL